MVGTYKLGVANELASEPEEGLLEVVVGLGRDVVVLEVLLSVEGDGLGLDLSLLDIDFVTAENNGDVLANSDKITCCNVLVGLGNFRWRESGQRTVPVGNVLVGDTGGDIEHDDTALAVDVVTVTETTELLLTGGIPDIELDLAEVLLKISIPQLDMDMWVTYGAETKRVNLDTEGGHVLLLEFTSQMALDKGGLFHHNELISSAESSASRDFARRGAAGRPPTRSRGRHRMLFDYTPFRYHRRRQAQA